MTTCIKGAMCVSVGTKVSNTGTATVLRANPNAERVRVTSPPYLSLKHPPGNWVAVQPQKNDDRTRP